MWRALVDGRWSLVDGFDSDGKRFVVARRNEPCAVALHTLTSRETHVASLAARGHSNKLIAYELGLSEATIATHVARAKSKLGVHSRVQLASVVSLLPASYGAPPEDAR
jgi:DNA-binding NarL/FixJ family response regulator